MYSQKLVRRFAILASTFAIIQSAIWFLGSLLVILLFYDFLSLDFDDGSLPDLVFELFMDQNDDTMILFVYIYAVLSLVLCVISSLIINAIVAKYETKIHKLYVSWAVNIIILSVVDIVLTCFLGRDLYNQSQPSQDVIYAYTIAILISIRGIIIWMINIILAGYMIVFAAQLSQHFQAPPNHNHVINAFEETSRPWHTDVANNPLAKTSRNENLTFGNNTNRSYNSLLAADELSIKSDLFKNNDKYEERLANIGKPGKRTPLKSPSPVNVPAPVAPPTIMRESSKDQETISDMFLDIDLQGVESESRDGVDPNIPYIPSPDYTPLNSPIPVAKKAKGSYGDTSSTLF